MLALAIVLMGCLGIVMIVKSESPKRIPAIKMIKGEKREQNGLFINLIKRSLPHSYINRIKEDHSICQIKKDSVLWLSDRIMTSFVVFSVFLILGFALLKPVLIVIGIFLAWLVYSVPLLRLRSKANNIRFNIEKDLNFMMTYITQVMLANVTPYDAVLSACKQMPEYEYMKGEINRLVSDVVTTGVVGKSFQHFSERVQSKSGKRFGVLLEQLEMSGDVASIDLLLHQNDLSERDKKKLFTHEIQKLPNTLMWINLVMFTNMVILPVFVVGGVLLMMFSLF